MITQWYIFSKNDVILIICHYFESLNKIFILLLENFGLQNKYINKTQ